MTSESEVRAVLDDVAAGIAARDPQRVVAHYDPAAAVYGLAPPLREEGAATDPAGLTEWFATWDGPIIIALRDLVVETSGDLALCYGLSHMTGAKDGEPVDLWYRSTVGLRRGPGGWRITHQHDSTPFYMDGSDRAALDLKPEPA
jgi:PhnB protein